MSRKRSGQLVIRKKGWCARITVNREGESIREVVELGTFDRTVAKRKLARLIAKGSDVRPADGKAEDTVQQFADEWLDRREAAGVGMVRDERCSLKLHVYPEIGPMPLSTVKPATIRAVLDAAIASGLSRTTIGHLKALLHRLFKAAWMDELIPENPVARVVVPRMKVVRKERCILTDAEFAAYMAHPSGDLEVKVMTLVSRIEGGMRTSDVIRWDWAHIDRVHFAECIIPRSKTATPQTLAMPEVVAQALRARWEAASRPEAGPVFPVQRGPRAGAMRATRGISFAKRLRRDLFAAGVSRVQPAVDPNGTAVPNPSDPLFFETATTLPVDFHSCRRAFSTALAEAGVNVQTAMRLSAHSDEKVHMRYVGRTAAMRQIPEAAVPKLPAGLFDSARSVPNADPPDSRSPGFAAPPRRLERPTNGLGIERTPTIEPNSPATLATGDRLADPSLAGIGAPCRITVPIRARAADAAIGAYLTVLADAMADDLARRPTPLCDA
jgi:integrase